MALVFAWALKAVEGGMEKRIEERGGAGKVGLEGEVAQMKLAKVGAFFCLCFGAFALVKV